MCDLFSKHSLSQDELGSLHAMYESEFDLPPEAHACDLKSSTSATGLARSEYAPPPAFGAGARG